MARKCSKDARERLVKLSKLFHSISLPSPLLSSQRILTDKNSQGNKFRQYIKSLLFYFRCKRKTKETNISLDKKSLNFSRKNRQCYCGILVKIIRSEKTLQCNPLSSFLNTDSRHQAYWFELLIKNHMVAREYHNISTLQHRNQFLFFFILYILFILILLSRKNMSVLKANVYEV